MQVISNELLGFCIYFPEQLFNFKRLKIENYINYIYICIYIKKLSAEWKNFHEQKVFLFLFYILCKNFSKIGPIIKKIPKF